MASTEGHKGNQADVNSTSSDTPMEDAGNPTSDDESEVNISTPGNSGYSRISARRGTEPILSKNDPCWHHRRPSAPSMRYDRKKEDNLFPPTKKYHYYPITCEYCLKRFQPNQMKAHQEKAHFGGGSGRSEVKKAQRSQSAGTSRATPVPGPSTPKSPSKSVGGMPRRMHLCYICGRMYGSTSLPIHEPKCLEKWKIQNDQLPPELRAPEPVKPQPIARVAADKGYSLPEFDPAAESAYQSHLSTLIPCPHCSRTFSPDRIQKHISCCIDRPRTREYKTPEGGEIKR